MNAYIRRLISLIDFDLGEAGINGTDYSIEFETAGPHSSLVAAKLDLMTEKVIFEFENINLPGWQFDGWEIFASAYDEWNVADMPGSRDFLEENSALLKQTEDGAISIIGGGDTASALKQYGLDQGFTHISTGGGASLQLMSGKELPALEALKEYA